jgi:hypothetical protein
LAEKYCLGELQDIMVDALIKYQKRRNELLSVDFTIRAYEQTSVGSPLARHFTRAIFHVTSGVGHDEGWKSADVSKLYRVLPNFAGECVAMQKEMPEGPDPRYFSRCYFHVLGGEGDIANSISLTHSHRSNQLRMRHTIPLTAADWLGYFERCHKVFGSRLCAVAS